MYAPLLPITLTVVTQLIGLREFGRAYRQRVGVRHYAYLVLGVVWYQWLLMLASVWAAVRHIRGNTTWHKTAHSGAHREAYVPAPRRAPAPVTAGSAAMESV
jgi:hypothetical protein